MDDWQSTKRKKANFMTKPSQQLLLDIAQEKERKKSCPLSLLFNHVRFMLIPYDIIKWILLHVVNSLTFTGWLIRFVGKACASKHKGNA